MKSLCRSSQNSHGRARLPLLAVAILSLAGCGLLPFGKVKQAPRVYLLDVPEPMAVSDEPVCGSVQIARGSSAAGQLSSRMVYSRERHHLGHFASARWAAAPSRQFVAVTERFLREAGDFRAVVAAPAAAGTDLRLEISDLSLLQRFSEDEEESAVELAFTATLYARQRPALLANKRFFGRQAADPDPRSGVRVANALVVELSEALRAFSVANCQLPAVPET